MKNKIFMPLILLSNCLIMFGQSNCIPSFSGSNIFIDNFAFHTLVNTYSGVDSDKYVFYPNTLFTTTVTIGKTYPITIAQNYSSGIYGKFAVWIDYNNDKLFDNSELVLYDSISHYTTSGFVNIPNNNNYVGQRRLRVIYAWYPLTVTPCGKFSDGECEDYIINIVSNQPDSQTYCIPFNPPGVDNFIIDDFHLGALKNNNSVSNSKNYIFYPQNTFSANLLLNHSYSIYVSKDVLAGNTGGYAVWIDLNDNGDFENSERLFYAGPNIYSATGILSIPNNTSFVGVRRLRVRSQWGNIPANPCGLYSAGETEDYLINILDNLTSINTLNFNQIEINVYPNPSSGAVYINSGSKINEVKIIDSFGQAIYAAKPNQNELSLNINNSGLYFITVTSLDKTITSKLIVEK